MELGALLCSVPSGYASVVSGSGAVSGGLKTRHHTVIWPHALQSRSNSKHIEAQPPPSESAYEPRANSQRAAGKHRTFATDKQAKRSHGNESESSEKCKTATSRQMAMVRKETALAMEFLGRRAQTFWVRVHVRLGYRIRIQACNCLLCTGKCEFH